MLVTPSFFLCAKRAVLSESWMKLRHFATQTCGADSKRISEFYQSYILKLRDDFKISAMGGFDRQDLPAIFWIQPPA
jgi:hypothetical protein